MDRRGLFGLIAGAAVGAKAKAAVKPVLPERSIPLERFIDLDAEIRDITNTLKQSGKHAHFRRKLATGWGTLTFRDNGGQVQVVSGPIRELTAALCLPTT